MVEEEEGKADYWFSDGGILQNLVHLLYVLSPPRTSFRRQSKSVPPSAHVTPSTGLVPGRSDTTSNDSNPNVNLLYTITS
jgi:hypothetical protein